MHIPSQPEVSRALFDHSTDKMQKQKCFFDSFNEKLTNSVFSFGVSLYPASITIYTIPAPGLACFQHKICYAMK